MKHKYNLVYIPLNKNREVTAVAQQFAGFAGQYLLGNNALPHVTLCQFEAEEKDLEKIWSRVEKMIHTKNISLRFETFSALERHDMFWVSLMPDKRDQLFELHYETLKVLEITGEVWFDPHMTLFNNDNQDFAKPLENLEKSYTPIVDDFALALGTSGFLGQFKKVLYCESVKI